MLRAAILLLLLQLLSHLWLNMERTHVFRLFWLHLGHVDVRVITRVTLGHLLYLWIGLVGHDVYPGIGLHWKNVTLIYRL